LGHVLESTGVITWNGSSIKVISIKSQHLHVSARIYRILHGKAGEGRLGFSLQSNLSKKNVQQMQKFENLFVLFISSLAAF